MVRARQSARDPLGRARRVGRTFPFFEQLAWLAGILEARDFPLDRLARNLELLAETVLRIHPEERDVSQYLERGAA